MYNLKTSHSDRKRIEVWAWKRKRSTTIQTSACSLNLVESVLPVDPLELALVVTLASQVYSKRTSLPCAEIYQQILIELRDLYSDEQEELYVSICRRLFALYQIIQSGALAEWVNPEVLHTQVPLPRILIFVASVLPLQSKNGFDPVLFIETLETCQTFCHK